ncbi:hypothetical protein LP43_1789 [Methylophaga thiooxydans]|uniref:Sulfotransferase n=1 Tax=Methylophaga thiooxydans TaxID=392484 RepID=A0A0A0BFV8_9GAMM|nr:sulfotransferase [Methylophaga thiooxydans]KGM06567.1 hypothetical protein LP43_1789 [Methylophaga thiooxydans]
MKLIILLYVPRSGSTFLSSQLAKKYSNILVMPEIRLPKLMLEKEANVAIRYHELKRILEKDHQISSLDITEEDIVDLYKNSQSLRPESVLLSLAGLIAQKKGRQFDAVVYKCGSAGLWWPALKASYPTASFIHVHRDVRAVVNSALHSQRPYHPGEKMGRGDPWFRAKGWNRYVTGMQKLTQAGEQIIQVSYEALCHNPTAVLDNVINQLKLDVGVAVGGEGISVATSEQDIHRNVNKPPLKGRLDAWQGELKLWQVVVSEHLATEGMNTLGYEKRISKTTSAISYSACLFYGFIFHVYATLKFKLSRTLKHSVSPIKLYSRIVHRLRTRNLRSRW